MLLNDTIQYISSLWVMNISKLPKTEGFFPSAVGLISTARDSSDVEHPSPPFKQYSYQSLSVRSTKILSAASALSVSSSCLSYIITDPLAFSEKTHLILIGCLHSLRWLALAGLLVLERPNT